jgi:uncharacterized protein DUF3857
MKNTFILLVLSICLQAHGQETKREFGKITQEEIKLRTYKKDFRAGGVVLFDIGETKFIDADNGYDIRFTRHKRVKIFKKTAFEHAEVSIPFYVDGYGKTEKVKSIEATTYNYEDGNLIQQQLDPTTVYEEKVNSRWRNKKFVFPNIQEGSIVEFKYVLETPFHFNLPDWTFQDKIPTIYSEYEVRMIPFYEYVFRVQGISKFDYKQSVVAKEKRKWGNISESNFGEKIGRGVEFQDYVHTYVLKDVPAFKDESFISSINDYIIKIDFQLSKFKSPTGTSRDIISTWSKLTKALVKNDKFGKYQKNCARIAKKILEKDLDISGLSTEEKSIKIIEYVKDNFNWDGTYSKYASMSAKAFITKKSGNTADINLFLLAMLKTAKIESHPVILSTRNHGKIDGSYPFDHFTNYVIVLVKTESPFFADGTEDLLPYNRLPTRCLNDKGLIVSEDVLDKWVRLENNIPSLEKNLIAIEIDPESLNASFNVSIQSTEYDAYSYRSTYKNDTTALHDFYSNKIGEIEAIKTLSYNEITRPYSISFEGTYETEKLGENVVINPFLNLAMSKNLLTQKERNYPVDFVYPSNELFEITLAIPNGFKITDIPESFTMDNDLAEVKINYSITENLLKVEGNYNFKKPIYVSDEYSKIKYYMVKIIEKFNEQLVLEKT